MLGKLFDFPEGTMAIGRLDEKSEGLLLLTTDGKVSERIRSKQVEKEYYAQLDGQIRPAEVQKLQEGVEIKVEGKIYLTKPCQASILTPAPYFPGGRKRGAAHGPTSWVSITLTEGKNRQVRKMTAAVGFPTLRLVRVRVGDFLLSNLNSGEVMEVKTLS